MTEGGTSSNAFPSFITSEMWLQDPNTSLPRYWVEEGIVNGWNSGLGSVVYADFLYYRDIHGSESGWFYLNYTVPNGTTHYFQISRGPISGSWLVLLDGTVELETYNLGFWTGRPVTGGECYCDATNEHADTFNMYTTAENSVGNIVNYSAAFYNTHAGMNGSDLGSYWAWNAP